MTVGEYIKIYFENNIKQLSKVFWQIKIYWMNKQIVRSLYGGHPLYIITKLHLFNLTQHGSIVIQIVVNTCVIHVSACI